MLWCIVVLWGTLLFSLNFCILGRLALCQLRDCPPHFSRAPRPAERARRNTIHQALLTSGETDNDEQNPLQPERKMRARTGWVGRAASLPTHLHKYEGMWWVRHLSNQKKSEFTRVQTRAGLEEKEGHKQQATYWTRTPFDHLEQAGEWLGSAPAPVIELSPSFDSFIYVLLIAF